jgi:transglutaminase/protease-like cytokinesis protein 3
LVDGVAVCDGLSKGYKLLLQSEGIDCWTGNSSTHMWNMAILDGEERKIDITQGVGLAEDYDGSYNERLAEKMCDKCFMSEQEYRDKWFSGYESGYKSGD